MGTLTLKEGTDMTHPKFLEWLNENFKKSSGKNFTAQDAYGYIKRGCVPSHFGLYKLETKENEEIGLKLVVVTPVSADWYVSRKEN